MERSDSGTPLYLPRASQVLFNTLAYAQFFAVVFFASWLCARLRKLRIAFLLAASYFFYAHWDYRFLPLIFLSSTGDWLLGNAIAAAKSPKTKKQWLVATLVLNLGLLGFFKYANFGIDSARSLLQLFGVDAPDLALQVALPVGISFFTFESMSYVIDIYRGQIKPHRSYLEYLTFVAFFPHLVAGPIIRPRDLLPQLAGPPHFSAEAGSQGLFLIAVGLIKKVAIGDYLALNLVDRVFEAPFGYSALEVYAAVLGYSLQIYSDFSGYTDIAIGSALLLGIRFPKNFDAPYAAVDIVDFWRRWHISLSSWLRDYLYIPLGGNRRGRGRTVVNLMITMLLGGLWHGASWTFVVWGGLHGAALALTRLFKEWRGESRPLLSGAPGRVVAIFFTFHLVSVAWIFFRADSFGKARLIFERLASFSTHHENLDARVVAVLALGLGSHYLPDHLYRAAKANFSQLPAPGQAVLLFGALLLLRSIAGAEAVPFVYFQF